MALVANYSGSEEDLSDSEHEGKTVVAEEPREPKRLMNGATTAPPVDDLISDEDEDADQLIPRDGSERFGLNEEDIPGLSTSNSLFSVLPGFNSNNPRGASSNGFVDENEDLSSIPQAKSSEKADAEAAASNRKNKKQNGKVRIVLPSLSHFGDGSDGEDNEATTARKKARMDHSRDRKNALLSMLPNPVNPVPSKVPERILAPDTVARRPQVMSTTTTTMMVPRSVKAAKTASASAAGDSDSDEDSHPSKTMSFFTLEQEKIEPIMPAEVPSEIESSPRPGPSQRAIEATPYAEPTGPAAGPSRPSPGAFHGAAGYSDAEDVMANNAALERLAGKHALRNKVEDFHDIVEVNQDNLKADEREWVTKALTEDAADKPGPRCTVKGQTKRKHQITYLAAIAKENEHKLKQQWSAASANKKAAGAKYGFF